MSQPWALPERPCCSSVRFLRSKPHALCPMHVLLSAQRKVPHCSGGAWHAAADAGRGNRRDEDGTQYYVLDYTARGATWFRHNVSVYAARCAGCAAAPMASCCVRAVCLHEVQHHGSAVHVWHSNLLRVQVLQNLGWMRELKAGRLARMAALLTQALRRRDGRLYTLNAQCGQARWPELRAQLRAAADSFHVRAPASRS